MSGLFNYFQLSASNFLNTARGFADNTLGSLFNLANLPKSKSELEPVPGFITSSHKNFLEVLKRDFLKNGNTPAALYPFLKGFEAGNPKVALHLNHLIYSRSQSKTQATPIQLFFCCLVASIELSNRPFYRVREAVDYIIDQYPAGFSPYALELLSLVDRYEQSLEEDPDFLLAKLLKQGINIIEEVDDDNYPRTLSISNSSLLSMMAIFPFESSSVERLDSELESYFESHFPELKTLLSDSYQYFMNKHLERLPADYHLNFYRILLDHVTRVSKKIEDAISYKDKISEVYLDKRDRLVELKGFLAIQIKNLQDEEKKLEEKAEAEKQKDEIKREAPKRSSSSSTVLTPIAQAVRKITRHFAKHPMQLFVVGLSFLGTKVSASSVNNNTTQKRDLTSSITYPGLRYNATVNYLFFQDLKYLYSVCGSRPNSTIFMVCPYTTMGFTTYSNTPGKFDSTKWLTVTTASGNISLAGTPTPSDVRFWSETIFGLSLYNCPYPWSGDLNTCTLQSFINTNIKIFTRDTPPFPIALSNDTQIDPTLQAGVQPIIGEGSSFSGNFLSHGAGDLESDTILFQPSLANGNRLPVWMTPVPTSGDISVVPPPGNAGRWNINLRMYGPAWDGKTVVDYNFNTLVWSSSLTVNSYILILNYPIQTNIPPNALYTIQSGQTLSISSPTSVLFYAASGTPVTVNLFPASNASIPTGMAYDAVRQVVTFVANPLLAQRGSYYFVYQGCDSPGFVCAVTPGCIPPLPTCANTSSTAIQYINTPAVLAQIFPSSTTIGTPVQTTVQGSDPDYDSIAFTAGLSNDAPSSIAVSAAVSSTSSGNSGSIVGGMATFLAAPGTPTGVTYPVTIYGDDGHGGITPQYWLVTLNARPVQVKSGLPQAIATTSIGTSGSTTFPFPFLAPDLTSTQIPAFATQAVFSIPSQLQPFINATLNTSSLLYDIAWAGIPGYSGNWPFVISYTDPVSSQQTTAQTIFSIPNPGAQTRCALVLTTGPVETSGSYDFKTCLYHPDPAISFTCSANLPAGFVLNPATCVLTWTIQPGTAGVSQIPVTTTDQTGKTLLPAPNLALTIPYSPPVISVPNGLLIPVNTNAALGPYQGSLNSSNLDGYPNTCKALSGATTIFSVAQDCSTYTISRSNRLQGTYSVKLQALNGDQPTQANFNFTIQRATIQLTQPALRQAFISQPLGFDACSFVTDPDNPGSCSNLRLTWFIPATFSATNSTANAVSTVASTATVNAPLGSGLQGLHADQDAIGFTWTDTLSAQTVSGAQPVMILNKAPVLANGVDLTSATPQDDQSSFTLSYMTATDPDGDPVNTTVTAIPPGCTDVPAQKIINCANVPADTYNILFSFTDPFGGFARSTLILSISAVVASSVYLALFIKIAPAVLGTIFSVSAPLVWSYVKDYRREKAANKQFTVLPDIIHLVDTRRKQIAQEKKVDPARLQLPTIIHPLSIKPLHESARRLVINRPERGAEASPESKEDVTSQTVSAQSSPISPTPTSAVTKFKKAGHKLGVLSRLNTTAPLTAEAAPRMGTPEASNASTRASELSVQLMTQINSVTGDIQTIEKFQTLFSHYITQVDRYHAEGGNNIANNCNLLLTAESLALRLNWLLTNAESYKTDSTTSLIDPHITMMVHWIKALYTRFVSYHSGLENRQAIKLKDKRSLLQNLSELVKAARKSLEGANGLRFEEGLALYKELEDLRGAITSIRDEVRPSLINSLMSPFRHSVDYGPASLPFKALYPKIWFPYTFGIQELSQMATINVVSLQLLNKLVAQANGEDSKTKLEVSGKAIPLEKLSRSKDRGVVNYFAADAYLGLLEYWGSNPEKIKPTDPRVPYESKYLECLFEAVAKTPIRTLDDQIGEVRIRELVHSKMEAAILKLLLNMPDKLMAAHLLLNLSPHFNQPMIRNIVTAYVKAMPVLPANGTALQNHRAIFYAELKKQFNFPTTANPRKPQEIKLWLECTPDDTVGIEDCRRELIPKQSSNHSLTAKVSMAFSSSRGRDLVPSQVSQMPLQVVVKGPHNSSPLMMVSNPLRSGTERRNRTASLMQRPAHQSTTARPDQVSEGMIGVEMSVLES